MVGSLKDANKELKGQIRKDKDVSEVADGISAPEVVTHPPPEKKHVRIQEDVVSSDDKTKLISSRGNSVESTK